MSRHKKDLTSVERWMRAFLSVTDFSARSPLEYAAIKLNTLPAAAQERAFFDAARGLVILERDELYIETRDPSNAIVALFDRALNGDMPTTEEWSTAGDAAYKTGGGVACGVARAAKYLKTNDESFVDVLCSNAAAEAARWTSWEAVVTVIVDAINSAYWWAAAQKDSPLPVPRGTPPDLPVPMTNAEIDGITVFNSIHIVRCDGHDSIDEYEASVRLDDFDKLGYQSAIMAWLRSCEKQVAAQAPANVGEGI